MKNFLFMAVASGKATSDAAKIKRYVGVATVQVKAVNPTKAQIKDIMGYEPKEEPVYFGVQEQDGKKVPFGRITFILETVPEKCNGIDATVMLSYYVRNQYRKGSNSGKYQVIDQYGRTAWGEETVVKAKGQIMYANGPANVTTDYRPAFVGEEGLTEFIKVFLNIPNPANYVNGTWIMKAPEDAKDSECRLDHVADYFKGNVSEIKECIALQPDNQVKVLFGIRTADDGRQYQEVYAGKILRANTTSYDKLKANVEENQERLTNSYYEVEDIHEYNVNASDLTSAPEGSADPFANAATEQTPW